MKELLERLFESREMSHVFHLNTESHAKHLALQEFYEKIVEPTDELIETYQGQYGILNVGSFSFDREVNKNDEVAYFKELSQFLRNKKKEIIKEENEHLISIFDDILILVFKTIYKLQNLK